MNGFIRFLKNNFLDLIILTIPFWVFPSLLYLLHEHGMAFSILAVSICLGLAFFIILRYLVRDKKEYIIRTTENYILLLTTSTFIFSIFYFVRESLINLSNIYSLNDYIILFTLGFVSGLSLWYYGKYLQRLYTLHALNFTQKQLQSFAENITISQINERLILIKEALEAFSAGYYLTTVVLVSNFFEEIVDFYFNEKATEDEKSKIKSFGKKAKFVNLNVKDKQSNFDLEKFYYKIRSKYAHEAFKKGPEPNEKEIKITLRLLNLFLEELLIIA